METELIALGGLALANMGFMLRMEHRLTKHCERIKETQKSIEAVKTYLNR